MSETGLPAVFAGGSFLLPFPPQEPRLKGENRAPAATLAQNKLYFYSIYVILCVF